MRKATAWVEGVTAVGAFLGILVAASQTHAMTVDLCEVFSNPGFEAAILAGWTVTRPNTNYVVSLLPAVNPAIDPFGVPPPLTAPVGSYFTGLTGVPDTGAFKLAHDAMVVGEKSSGKCRLRVETPLLVNEALQFGAMTGNCFTVWACCVEDLSHYVAKTRHAVKR